MTGTRSEKMARSKRVIAESGAELMRRYEAGESLPALAGEFGLHVGTLSVVIKRLGGTIRTHNPNLKASRAAVAAHRDEIVARYVAGEDGGSIGREFSLAHATVVRLVREAGERVRSRGPSVRVYGPENPSWKTGSTMKDGYRMVRVRPDDPMSSMSNKGYVLEHRLVMARMIKRSLLPTESVHHIDGDRLNNTPDNLQLRVGQHGKGIHLRCHDCGSQNVGPAEL